MLLFLRACRWTQVSNKIFLTMHRIWVVKVGDEVELHFIHGRLVWPLSKYVSRFVWRWYRGREYGDDVVAVAPRHGHECGRRQGNIWGSTLGGGQYERADAQTACDATSQPHTDKNSFTTTVDFRISTNLLSPSLSDLLTPFSHLFGYGERACFYKDIKRSLKLFNAFSLEIRILDLFRTY